MGIVGRVGNQGLGYGLGVKGSVMDRVSIRDRDRFSVKVKTVSMPWSRQEMTNLILGGFRPGSNLNLNVNLNHNPYPDPTCPTIVG